MRVRHSHWIALGCALVAIFAAYVLGTAWVEATLVERLERRGFVASVENVGLRLGGLQVTNLHATHRSQQLTLEMPNIRVHMGLSGIQRISVFGGNATVSGDLSDVRTALLGNKSGSDGQSTAKNSRPPVVAKDLNVRWERPLGAGSKLTVVGLELTLEDQVLDVRAAAFEVQSDGTQGHFERVVANISTRDLAIAHLAVGSGEASLNLAHLGPASAPPAPTPSPRVLPKRAKPSAPVFPLPPLAPSRGPELRRLAQQGAGILARRLPDTGNLSLSQMVLSLHEADQRITIGPGTLYARREGEKVQVGFASTGAPGNTALDMHVQVPLADGPVEARVKGGPIPLATLGIAAGSFGLQEVEDTSLTLDAQVTLSADGKRAQFSSLGEVNDLAIQHERLAPHVLTNIDVGWSVNGHVLLDGSEVLIDAGKIRLGNVNAVANANVAREAERLRLDANFRVEEGSCQEMFEALPRGAVPLLSGARLTGTFSWRAGLHLDTDHLASTKAQWNMRNHCRFQQIPEDAHPEQFRRPFSLHVPDADGQPMKFRTGPGSSRWAPREEISPFMEAAVLTTEDGGFWTHRGFDSNAIEGAIRRNLQRGEFSRGASTITMQLAKNLYLERDKYIARKIQEALFTMLLEQELRKPEILELYLNVIEYGPGVYGIRNAAKHYFASRPSELSVAQCFFLASLLPRPKAQHFDHHGQLIPLRASLVRNLMKIAHERKRLSPDDLEKGLTEQVRFGMPSLETNPYRHLDGYHDGASYGDGDSLEDDPY